MSTFIYQLFKKDKANVALLAIVCLLLCTIIYKELEFRRWQRCHYGVVLLQTPGVTNYLYYMVAWSDKDSYYPYGVSISGQKIGDYYYGCESSEKLLLPPDKMSIKWTSVADRKHSWVASIDLDENYLKQYKGNQFAVQLQKDGKVKLYVTNAAVRRAGVKDESKLKEVGIYQAKLVEPEKMIANVVKELLHIDEMNPTKEEMNDSVSKLLDKAFDVFLSATPVANDSLKACLSTLLREEDTKWFEDPQEARRIKKRRASCLLALALLSDEEERDELENKAFDCVGGADWDTSDKELADVYIGIRLIRLLFQLQQNPLNVTHSLLRIGEHLRNSEEYITEQRFKHSDDLIQFCLGYYY